MFIMKRLAFLLFALAITCSSYSQKPDNEIYFRLGYSSPTWNQYGMNKGLRIDGVEKFGGHFEFGSIFMIQSIPAAQNMALGINVDYLYSNLNSFHLKNEIYEQNYTSLRVGSKIGPSFTYCPAKKVAIDIYAKADIAWATVAVPYEDQLEDIDDYFYDFVNLGFSTGINFRYGILMLGIEYDTVSPELVHDDYDDVFLQEIIRSQTGEGDTGNKSRLPCVNFTVGLSF